MAYSAPRTWAPGEYPTAAQLNQDLRDNVSFLANPPACRIYHNTTQSMTDNTEMTVLFNSERYDIAGMHDPTTNTGRITFPVAGLYIVGFAIEIAVAADYTLIYTSLRVNGTTSIGETAQAHGSAAFAPHASQNVAYKFAAGDYVELRAFQDNTANAARNCLSTANRCPEFWATWVGLG